MSRTVYKYEIPMTGDYVEIKLPRGAEILHVAAQHETPYLWALVDPKAPLVSRRLRFAGTGHTIAPDVGRHLGSFFVHDGALVFHIFETTVFMEEMP
ncbi:MAG: hypothetical protein Q8S13_02575 [Dehalococcoidia bacterium]|nr:hypothetical protein [Dehalococcoidia bacterium]